MCASFETKQNIRLREPATVIPCPLPQHYEFLRGPVPRRKYRINFRHPAYEPDDNILFTLYAWDHNDGGIHHGFAHNACSIFADNHTDGYLSQTCEGEHGERIHVAWDEVLPAAVVDYYFYVPYPPGELHTTAILGRIENQPAMANIVPRRFPIAPRWAISTPVSMARGYQFSGLEI